MKLNNRVLKGQNKFEKFNWLPVNDRFEQIVSSMSYQNFEITRALRML